MKRWMQMMAVIGGACLFWADAAEAATAHYEWIETPRPPAPHGVKRWITTAWFDVDLADITGGTIWASDILADAVRPAQSVAVFIVGGSLTIDPFSLQPIDGLMLTAGTNPYYRTGTITPWRINSDNPLGGGSVGHWTVTVTP